MDDLRPPVPKLEDDRGEQDQRVNGIAYIGGQGESGRGNREAAYWPGQEEVLRSGGGTQTQRLGMKS